MLTKGRAVIRLLFFSLWELTYCVMKGGNKKNLDQRDTLKYFIIITYASGFLLYSLPYFKKET